MRLSPIASAMLALSAAPAFAQAQDTDNGEVAIQGTVTPLCVLGEPSQATIDLGNMIATSGQRVGRITAIGAQNVTLPNSFCNFAGSVASVEASALVETAGGSSSPPTGFARAVNYAATAGQWGGNSASAETAAAADGSSPVGTGSSAVQPAPRLTDITVTLSAFTAPGDGLLMAGDYEGLVRITLGPAAIVE